MKEEGGEGQRADSRTEGVYGDICSGGWSVSEWGDLGGYLELGPVELLPLLLPANHGPTSARGI